MSAIPITLITGFLGSGKSTLINRLLSRFQERKFGLVVNEFGDVNLESSIVKTEDESIVELSNGCMCCVVRGDILRTVDGLLQRSPETSHILMEASGLSDPVPIANTFLNSDLDGRVRFDSIVCVLDLEQYRRNLSEYEIPLSQLEYADFIVLSKTSEVTSEQIDEAKRFLGTVETEATIVRDDDERGLSLILDTLDIDHTDIRELEIAEHDHSDHSHEDGDHEHSGGYHHAHESVTTLFFRSSRPVYADHFGKVFQSLPAGVVRAKGFLDLADEESGDRKYILQYTGARKDLYSEPWNADETRQTAIVFIGKDYDADKLRNRLNACVYPLQSSETV